MKKNYLCFNNVIHFYSYSGVFKYTLRGSKYFGLQEPLLMLCRNINHAIILDALKEYTHKRSFLISVPLHKRRLSERGFNQSLLIARYISELTGIPVMDKVVQRSTYTEKQARLPQFERINNVKKAFSLSTSVESSSHHIIVDDVWTTGSTVTAIAELLRKNGVTHISAVSLAT